MGYAIGPSQTDPRTGEILNADVLISSTFVTGWGNEYEEMVGPNGLMQRYMEAQQLMEQLPSHLAGRMCLAEMGKTHQFGLQHTMLAGMGLIDGTRPMPEKYLGDALRDLIMHEVGHTLGLRHNFKGSSAIPYDQLNDEAFTQEHGLTLSVMDYAGTNVALDPKAQGHYVNMEIGSYDVWAIQYAYQPILVTDEKGSSFGPAESPASTRPASTPEEELPALRKIAEQAADPMHAYNTDEDTHRGAMSLDPLSNTWDLGSDPLAFANDRAALVERIMPIIEDRLIEDGEGYQRLRGAVNGLVFEQITSLLPVTKNVGGSYFARDHKGDPNGRMPFTPVSAEKQREAVDLIINQAFAEGALQISADMLNKMPPNRYGDWSNNSWSSAIDVQIHEMVRSGQSWLMSELMHNGRLARMINNEVRMPAGQEAYTVAELFDTMTGAIWSEIGNPARPKAADSFRRNLQRTHLDQLTHIMLDIRPYPSYPSAPEDARSLARYELTQLSAHLAQALSNGHGLDTTARAHLMASKDRIDQALDTSLMLTRELK